MIYVLCVGAMSRRSNGQTARKALVMSARKKAAKTALVLDHRPGSRKLRVHMLFDAKGAEAAFKFGSKLKLKPNTLRSWFVAFRKCRKGDAAKLHASHNA